MTALAILRLVGPYVLCVIVGGYLTHSLIDAPRYDGLQTTLANERSDRATERAKGQEAARDALQAQIQTRLQTEANNTHVIAQLQAERDRAVSDRDIAERLLLAAKASSRSAAVPQAPDRPGTAPAGPADSGGGLAEALAAAIDECRGNANQLDALIAELKPQL